MRSTDNFSISSEGDYATTVILILAFIFYLNRKSIKEYVIKNFEKFTLVYGYILVIGISLLLLGFVSTFEIVKEGFEMVFSGVYWFYQKLTFYMQFIGMFILYFFSIAALCLALVNIINKLANLKKRFSKNK
jgi:hypothetical protein